MKKYLLLAGVLTMFTSAVEAQSFIDRLGQRAKQAAENAVERNVENKVGNAVDDAFNGNNDKGNKNNKKSNKPNNNEVNEDENNSSSNSNNNKPAPRIIEATYAKCDFVPGDEIIFDDDLATEQIGEFPSKWDLVDGNSEVVKFDGKMTIGFVSCPTVVTPLMKNSKNYLTEEFTIEFDFFAGDNSSLSENLLSRSQYFLQFYNEADEHVLEYEVHTADVTSTFWRYNSTLDKSVSSELEIKDLLIENNWNHFSLSFNKRALKVYINGTRVTNVPNMKAPSYVNLESRRWQDHGVDYVTNFRICKGAVPLYDRMMTDGKIISYGITFDINKSTIKPESMVEISRIKKLMDENPDLKFEVQGHTDNTGSASTNQTLSEQRAQAIVNKLVELGISKSRLTAVGKGQTTPLADNSTDEGRAKNRRVEFVKK